MKKGLVLEGGGVKGAYQIGAYYAFKECKIDFDGFVGTSIGSFNAAMLASGQPLKLLEFWYNVNPGELFGFDKRFIDYCNDGSLNIESLKGALSTLKKVVTNLGVDNKKMQDKINELLNIDNLMKSDKDFGLVTVKMRNYKPVYVYKEDIKTQEELSEYIIASCYIPLVFRERKLLDQSYYLDGGFYDNAPIKLLADRGYDMLYVIDIKGIGFKRKNKYNNVKVVEIKPSRPNGGILELNKNVIRDNIEMGYYDTYRVLKKLDGYKYCFKRRSNRYYKRLLRNVPSRLLQRVKSFFGVETSKAVVIKAIEYVMEHENIDYYQVYNSYKIIKKYRYMDNRNFVYKFISYIRFL